MYLNFYNIKTKEKQRKFINLLIKIVDLDISPNGQNIALTGIKDGKVDLRTKEGKEVARLREERNAKRAERKANKK